MKRRKLRPYLAVSSTAALVTLFVSGCADRATPQGEGSGDGPVGQATSALLTGNACVYGQACQSVEATATIERGGGVGNVFDTGINDNGVSSNGGSGTSGTIPIGESVGTARQELMNFDLTPITNLGGAGYNILEAQVSLSFCPGSAGQTINVHQSNQSWGASTAQFSTYETTVSWPSYNESFVATPITSFGAGAANSFPGCVGAGHTPNNARFDISSLVSGWVNGTFAQDGILMEQPPVANVSITVLTSEYPPALSGYHPTMFVEYNVLCAAGTADCNDNGTDGCETNITTTQNCGACGNVCPTGNVCQSGACVPSCAAGQTLCSGVCVDESTDPNNCGACGTVCPAGDVCQSGVCSCPNPAGQVVDLWTGNGNYLDSVGANNGTPVGAVGFAPGSTGEGFSFTGSGYVSLGTGPDVLGAGAFTVGAWIKTTHTTGMIINQRDATAFADANPGEYALSVGNTTPGKVNWYLFGSSGFDFNITSVKSVDDGQFHYVVGARDANGTGLIYIDGVLDSSQSGPAEPLVALNVYIGQDERNAVLIGQPLQFIGIIDQVQIGTGATCETPSACYPNPCQNGGTCTEVSGAAVCTCTPAFMGATCQTPVPCIPNPCQHGGTCADVNGAAVCTCTAAGTGATCQTPTPGCPCNFAGTWVVDQCQESSGFNDTVIELDGSQFDNYFAIDQTGGDCWDASPTAYTYISGLDPTQVAACTADLLAYDTQNFCGQCVAECGGLDDYCSYNPAGDDYGSYCY